MFIKPSNEEAIELAPTVSEGVSGLTAYGVAQVINGWLEQENLRKTNPKTGNIELVQLAPQQVYTATRSGALRTVDANGKAIVPAEDAEKYAEAKYARLFAKHAADPANEGRYDHLLNNVPEVVDFEDIEAEEAVEDDDDES